MSKWSEEYGYRELARLDLAALVRLAQPQLDAAGVTLGSRIFMLHDPTDSAVLFCEKLPTASVVTELVDADPR